MACINIDIVKQEEKERTNNEGGREEKKIKRVIKFLHVQKRKTTIQYCHSKTSHPVEMLVSEGGGGGRDLSFLVKKGKKKKKRGVYRERTSTKNNGLV